MAQVARDPQLPQQPYNTLPPLSTMTQGIHQDVQKQHASNYEVRDSGNWSMPSKHSSTVSNNTGISHLLNPDDSPRNRLSEASGLSSVSYASSNNSNSQQPLPHLNQAYGRRESDAVPGTFLDSRRSSIDSSRLSMNMNMNHLAMNNPTSPYESTNASQTSLASSLQQQRGIQTPGQPRLTGSSSHSVFSPLTNRPLTGRSEIVPRRQAPPIAPPGSRAGVVTNPNANTPTKGQAWAFPEHPDPDDDDDMGLSSPASSRQGSFAFGQVHDPLGFAHGSLHQRSVASFQSGDSAATGGPGNYSRTPELRVSHKLAERKRRSEMKDLFDQLNTILPNSPGNKSSKWEVLTKAIDYIQHIQGSNVQSSQEREEMKTELSRLQKAAEESRSREAEMAAMYQQLCRLDPNSQHTYGPATHAMEQQRPGTNRLAPMQQTGHQQQQPQQQQPTPPTVNGRPSWIPAGGAMQGVEYGGSYDRR